MNRLITTKDTKSTKLRSLEISMFETFVAFVIFVVKEKTEIVSGYPHKSLKN